MKKRIIALSLALLVGSNAGVYGAEITPEVTMAVMDEQLTGEEAADALNEINILKGDGTSYNLEGELTRAEGATFIVRLLGKEDLVNDNKIDYVAKNFSDVYAHNWFSPYVGYCVQEGIINGYTDGTFRPDDTLSEQAFMKMVLGAMGYTYGVDFTWNETFGFAYDQGVVTDEAYEDLEEKDEAYTRGQVVDLLYHVIGQPYAGNVKDMVDVLIENEVLTRDKAVELGFVKDSLVMEVEAIKQSTGMRFSVTLNEIPIGFDVENVVVSEKYSDETLEIVSVNEMDTARTYSITTGTQIPDKEYVLTLVDIKDALSNVMPEYTYEFFGYRSEDYVSNYYRISGAELIKSNQLDVTLTQPVDIDAIDEDDITINREGNLFLEGNENTMALTADGVNPYLLHIEFLAFDFTFEDSFEVLISGAAKSMFGGSILDGQGDSARFTTVEMETEVFMLKEVVLEDENNLVLRFNKNVREVIAEQVYSYEIKTSNDMAIKIEEAAVIESGEYAGKAVRLTTEMSIGEGKEYTLLINQAYDTDRTESIIEELTEFVATAAVNPVLTIESAATTYGDRLEVVVDTYLDEETALDESNYLIKDVSTGYAIAEPDKIYYDKYGLKPILVLEFNNTLVFTNRDEYELTISDDVKTAEGLNIKEDTSINFVDVKADYVTSKIESANYIGSNIVKISGTKELALEVPNVLNTNYHLQYTVNDEVVSVEPIGVTYFNPNIILLRFEEFDTDKTYELVADKIKTESGESIDTSGNLVPVSVEVLDK